MATYLENLIDEARLTPEFITQYAISNLIADIIENLEASGIPRAELARRAGLDRAQITRLLKGDQNVTVKTLGRIAAALGKPLEIRMKFDNAKAVKAHENRTADQKSEKRRAGRKSKPGLRVRP